MAADPATRFASSLRIVAWSFFLFAVMHLVVAPWAFVSKHPIIPIKSATVEWEVANNEFVLGIFFVWSGLMCRVAADNWSTRGRLEFYVTGGALAYWIIDGVYLAVRPMPGGTWWRLLSWGLALFMVANAWVSYRALRVQLDHPAPRDRPDD